MNELGQQFITIEQAEKRRHHLLVDYAAFREWDRPHQRPILTPVKAALESWFETGVTYDWDPILGEALRAANIMVYTNAPVGLRHGLEVARGEILLNTLEWRGVPEYVGSQVLMLFRSIPSWESGLKRELKAVFEQRLFPLPYGPVFWTRDRQLGGRAEFLGNLWYDLQSQEVYRFVSGVYATKGDGWRPRSTRAIEKTLDSDQRLRNLGLSRPERYVYYACQHFECGEVAEFSTMIGYHMSPEAVRKLKKRIEEKLA
jgi:hypothetical protein